MKIFKQLLNNALNESSDPYLEIERLKKELEAEVKRSDQDIKLAWIEQQHAVQTFKAKLARQLRPHLSDVIDHQVTQEELESLPSGERILLFKMSEILVVLRENGFQF